MQLKRLLEATGMVVVGALLSVILAGAIHYRDGASRDVLFLRPAELIERFGPADAGSYLLGGIAIASGDFLGEHSWVLRLWPPGMAHILSLLVHSGLPVGLSLLFISVGFFSLAGQFLFEYLRHSKMGAFAYVAWVIWLVNPFMLATFGPGQLFYSDGLGSSGLVVLILSWRVWIDHLRGDDGSFFFRLGPLVFALASVVTVSLRWAAAPIVALLWVLGWMLFFRQSGGRIGILWARARDLRLVRPLVVAFIAALPWTLYVTIILHPPIPLWSVGTGYLWGQRWLADEHLPGFLVEGNANWACDLSPKTCSELGPQVLAGSNDWGFFRNEAFVAAASRPMAFMGVAGNDAFRAWFSEPFSSVGSFIGWPLGTLSALLLALAILAAVARRNWVDALALGLPVATTFAVLALMHFETRYLLGLHSLAFSYGLVVLAKAALSYRMRNVRTPG